jgi:hypothetical protein
MTDRPLADYKFTFLQGVRIRSGTNYIAKVMSCNPHVQLVPPKKTTDEFPVMRNMEIWEKGFTAFLGQYKGPRGTYEFRRFLSYFGAAWLRYLVDLFSLQPGHVFLKDPSVRHLDRFFEMFPDAKLIILVRDGRDNVASSEKAALARRTDMSLARKSRTRLNHLLMRDFVQAARDWAVSVDRIVRFDEEFKCSPLASRYLIVRYEDIYRSPREMGRRLFEFMEVPWDDAILDAVENAEVVGSSFYGAEGREDARKPNWTATPKSEAFQPIGRWSGWNGLRKKLFKRIAGRQLIQMGYEQTSDWR